jgi:hypothetical protein
MSAGEPSGTGRNTPAVVATGTADYILPLDEIASVIRGLVSADH